MPKAEPKFKAYRSVIVARALYDGGDAKGLYIRELTHNNYAGLHLVRVSGVDIAVEESRITKDYDENEP